MRHRPSLVTRHTGRHAGHQPALSDTHVPKLDAERGPLAKL